MYSIYDKVTIRSQLCQKFNEYYKNNFDKCVDMMETCPDTDMLNKFCKEYDLILRYNSKTPLELLWWAFTKELVDTMDTNDAIKQYVDQIINQ